MKSVCFSGRKLSWALGAMHEALAAQSARADGDLGLKDVVAGAERIAIGIEEGEHALLLVVVQHLPGMRQRHDHARDRPGEIEPAHPGEKHHARADDREQRGGAEIRLGEREQSRHADHQERWDQGVEPPNLLRREPLIVARDRQNEGDLHHLRGLEAQFAKAQASACAPPLSTPINGTSAMQHQRAQDKADKPLAATSECRRSATANSSARPTQ